MVAAIKAPVERRTSGRSTIVIAPGVFATDLEAKGAQHHAERIGTDILRLGINRRTIRVQAGRISPDAAQRCGHANIAEGTTIAQHSGDFIFDGGTVTLEGGGGVSKLRPFPFTIIRRIGRTEIKAKKLRRQVDDLGLVAAIRQPGHDIG